MDVTSDRVDVPLTVDENAVESTTKERSIAFMSAIEPLRIDLPDVFHRPAQLSIRTSHQQVIVVRHQAVRVDFDPEPADSLSDNRQKEETVRFVEEDELMIRSPIHHVVMRAIEVDARWSCHGRALFR